MKFEDAIAEIISKNNELHGIQCLVSSLIDKNVEQKELIKQTIDTRYNQYLIIKDFIAEIKLSAKINFNYCDDFIDLLIRRSYIEKKFIAHPEYCERRDIEYWRNYLYDFYKEFSDEIDKLWRIQNSDTVTISNNNPFYIPIKSEVEPV